MDHPPGIYSPTGSSPILSWEHTCHLLGGERWKPLSLEGPSSSSAAPNQDSSPCLDEYFTHRPQFFFSTGNQPPWPLELFWLKWRLLTSLASNLYTYHATRHSPYLGLCPGRVNVEFPCLDDPTIPPRWSFLPTLSTQECATPYIPTLPTPLPQHFPSALFQPPRCLDISFAHPWAQEFTLGQQESGTALIRSMEVSPPSAEGAGTTHGLLTLYIYSDALSSKPFSDHDVFFIHLSPLSNTSRPLEMWARPIDSEDHGLLVQGICQPLPTADWEHFYQNRRESFTQSQVTIFCSFHVPCDVYSLGMMIFYVLLGGHRPEKWQAVTQLVPSLISSFEHLVQSVDPSDPFELGYALRRRLAEEGPVFSKAEVVSPPSSISTESGSIPDALWDEALVTAFQLISHLPGLSFCSHPGDCALDRPASTMERVLRKMESLGEGIRLDLFGSTLRNSEILGACKLLRQERFPQEAPTSS